MILGFDAETSSTINLTTMGSDAYTRNPSTRCLMCAFKPLAQPQKPVLWREGDPVPYALIGHAANGGQFSGWNVLFFDRLVWNRILVPKHGFPPMSDDGWRDSMHLAAAANLPRSLDGCAGAVGAPFQSDLKDQNRIRRITDANRTVIPAPVGYILDHPEEFEPKLVDDLRWLADRCVQDVELEENVLLRLPPWPDVEPWIRMPYIDRRINDRGVLVDLPLVEGLERAAKAETNRLNGEMSRLTGGEVDSTTKIEPLKRWLVARGTALPLGRVAAVPEDDDGADDPEDEKDAEEVAKGSPWRLRKTDIADILARPDVPEECRQALLFRTEAAKASVRKLRAMRYYADQRGQLLGLFKLMGAQQTGRFSSGGPQLHNLVRDVFANPDEIAETNGLDAKKHKERVAYLQAIALTTGIVAGTEGDLDTLRALYERHVKDAQGRVQLAGVLTWISRMLRRTLAARAGHVLLNGDYSAAQARITAWLAQQNDVLAAYARGEDVYRFTASGMYHVPPEQITKLQRQAGKVSILAGGFGGGPTALLRMAYQYGMLLSMEEAIDIVGKFRETNGMTRAYWYATDDAAANAVLYPGREFPVPPLGAVTYFMSKDGADCLCCRLPSGRLLRYWAPRLHQDYWQDGSPKQRPSLTYLAIKGKVALRKAAYHTILCLAADTRVVTDSGVKQLLNVTREDMVWDGIEWVRHTGVVFQGYKQTISFGGVRMTEDHKVLHGFGWSDAGNGSHDDAAATYQRHFRFPQWYADRRGFSWFGRSSSSSLAGALRLRCNKRNAWRTPETRAHKKLWMQSFNGDKRRQFKAENTRKIKTSRLHSVAEYAGAMPQSVAFCVSKLWRQRHFCVRRMAEFLRVFLARHGFFVPPRIDAGAHGQHAWVLEGQLCLDIAEGAELEQTIQYNIINLLGRINRGGDGTAQWNRQDNTALSTEARMAYEPRAKTSGKTEAVYDIVDAGPRHRFTVIGDDGRPFIVSNCNNQVQAIEIDMLCQALANMDDAGLPVVLHVHDNAAPEVPEDDAERLLPLFKECMLSMPAWTQGLPIAVDAAAEARFG